MTKQQILQELEGLVSKMDINLRYEKGNIKGGLCRFNERHFLIVNKQFSVDDKIDTILQSLKNTSIEEIYVPPKVRELFSNL